MPTPLEHVHNVIFVLGIDLRKAVSPFDRIGQLAHLVRLRIAEDFSVEDVGSQPQFPSDFLRDRHLVARHHLHLDAHLVRRVECLVRVLPRRIVERQERLEAPPIAVVARHTQRAKATPRKVIDRSLHFVAHVIGIGGQLQDDLRRALRRFECLPVCVCDVRLCALAHRIEGQIVGDGVPFQLR